MSKSPTATCTQGNRSTGNWLVPLACLLVIALCVGMIDLKGIANDEAIRLFIMNGGQDFGFSATANPNWAKVQEAISPYAYQPLYYLIQNTVMGVAQSHNVVLLRLVNVFFLWLSLQGLIALSKGWAVWPRLFLIGVFSFNAFLIMHVLQLREYPAAIAFYIWSCWLVFRLDACSRPHLRTDAWWFAAYGILLALGFYLQTWVVLPAIGQFLFLVVRRREFRWRFYAYLAISYVIVLAATVPYLRSHPQKVNVGRWGTEGTALLPQLSDGFHLVLTGHVAGHSTFTDFLFWFQLLLLAVTWALFFSPKFAAVSEAAPEETKRQSLLMILCSTVVMVFQIGYFYRADNLSVANYYFIIHYFFLTWLVVRAFKYLHDLGSAPVLPLVLRRSLQIAASIVTLVMAISSIYQVRSYYRYPYFDTFHYPDSNWPLVAAGLSRILEADDVVLTRNFIHRTALTFTRPLHQRVVPIPELQTAKLGSTGRLVYLETNAALPARATIVSQLATLGYEPIREIGLPSAGGQKDIPLWRVLIFKHR